MAIHDQMTIGGRGGVRARALAAAGQILAEGSVEEMSLRGIAERADIGLASIYHHFASKEELLLHLALRGFADLCRELEASRDGTGLDGPMRRAARAFFTFADRRAPLFALMFDPRMHSRHEKLREAEGAAREIYVTSVLRDTRLPEERRRECAMAIWTLGRGLIAVNASYPGGRMPKEMSDSMWLGIGWLIDR